ncbi:hypothetical protein PB2503_06182 [Parvularcula bermudensis HTCC2503]|uniref:Uncharacterized protein n=1 Tax=Parvularcula bermudensis (strain ATCC BAA-594 / HTCC2503 / KCTC 12087) TaxID=314260 RepID=E0THK6_PARBH|nr:hypothetical protein PB2503_06182 [Parvularcula bermudensis HTCC2503]
MNEYSKITFTYFSPSLILLFRSAVFKIIFTEEFCELSNLSRIKLFVLKFIY